MTKVILLVVHTILVFQELVTQPHVIERRTQLVRHAAKKSNWHALVRVETQLGWSRLKILLKILLHPMIILLKTLRNNHLPKMINALKGGSCRKMSQIISESLFVD